MPTTPNVPVMEAYPDRILARLEERDRRRAGVASRLRDTLAFELVVEDLKLWRSGSVSVSFKGGDSTLHSKIAKVAKTWSKHGDITLDFGNGKPHTWTKDDTCRIRVGFEHKGYWSLVGTDSTDPSIVSPGEITLNLKGFDERLPTDWAGTVLHEFGHALGFHHEHQSPASACDFDWDKLYTYLGGPPNNWPTWKVDHNLRQLPATGLSFSQHDRHSIMHYSFPEWMFRSGSSSVCFIAPNERLSASDKVMTGRAYPRDEEAIAAFDDTRIESLESILESRALPDDDQPWFEEHFAFLMAHRR